jgi:ADP-ribose pyrophosphatase
MRYSRKKVFHGRIFRVFRENKKLPNGREVSFEEVDHPGAALIVPFIKNKVVFIRQYRAVIGKYIWELPAGKLDPGETPRACAKREIEEETGYVVGGLKKIGVIYTSPGFCNERIHIYKTECKDKKETRRDEDELIRVRLLTGREIRKLFAAGKINDSKTISALSFAGIL